MKMFRWISVLLMVAMLAACAPAAASEAAGAKNPAGTDVPAGSDAYPAPTTEVTQAGYPAPAVNVPTTEPGYPAPATNDNLPAACKVDGMTTYTDANGRFCFAYPTDFSLEGDGLVGPAQDPDVARARLAILSEALESGKDLAGVVAARLAGYGDATVKQADTQLGGGPAVSLEAVPGDPGSLDIVSVHGGEVITLRFQPNVEIYPQSRMDRDALADAVTKSFTWLK